MLRVQLFAKLSDPKEWPDVVRNPQKHLNAMALRMQSVESVDVIYLFGFRKPDDAPCVLASIRVPKTSSAKLLAASGENERAQVQTL